MTLANVSLRRSTGNQLHNLCDAIGLPNSDTTIDLLAELLGPTGEKPLVEPPIWPSDISDDNTPIEFSVAFDRSGKPVLRLLGETIANYPGIDSNARATRQALESLTKSHEVHLDRFDEVAPLFLPEEPLGGFGLWYSVILRHGTGPEFKAYLCPDARGRAGAPALVADGLRRLGLTSTFPFQLRPGQDHLAYFALDLHTQPRSRVKVYVSHEDPGAAVVRHAASTVPGVDADLVAYFYAIACEGDRRFRDRLPMSSYTFTGADPDVPDVYSLYLPIREVVPDDEVARDRVLALMNEFGLDSSVLDRALAAVSRRSLRDGVGLIAHVSLRLGPTGPGMTVYLSAEAYRTTPPRQFAKMEEFQCR